MFGLGGPTGGKGKIHGLIVDSAGDGGEFTGGEIVLSPAHGGGISIRLVGHPAADRGICAGGVVVSPSADEGRPTGSDIPIAAADGCIFIANLVARAAADGSKIRAHYVGKVPGERAVTRKTSAPDDGTRDARGHGVVRGTADEVGRKTAR